MSISLINSYQALCISPHQDLFRLCQGYNVVLSNSPTPVCRNKETVNKSCHYSDSHPCGNLVFYCLTEVKWTFIVNGLYLYAIFPKLFRNIRHIHPITLSRLFLYTTQLQPKTICWHICRSSSQLLYTLIANRKHCVQPLHFHMTPI